MKVSWEDTRTDVGKKPAAHFAIDQRPRPFAFTRGYLGPRIGEFFRILRKHRIGKGQALGFGDLCRSSGRMHEEIVDVDIDAELRGRCHADAPPWQCWFL